MKRIASVVAVVVLIGCIKAAHSTALEKSEAGTEVITMASVSNIAAYGAPAFGKQGPCPQGMVEVNGDYCNTVEQECLQWVDATGARTEAPKPGMTGRCGVWKFPSKCLSPFRVHKHFCIDRFEYPNVEGEKPKSWMSWYDMRTACSAIGKRLCTRSEWTFACEGPEMKPYPYGDGYHRDRTACNFDNPMPKGLDIMHVTKHDSPGGQILDGLLVPAGSMPRCVSPFGVYDQVGNIDESIVNETGQPYVSGLMSGHVFGVRNACRPMTEIHGPDFSWYETGGRCCSSTSE